MLSAPLFCFGGRKGEDLGVRWDSQGARNEKKDKNNIYVCVIYVDKNILKASSCRMLSLFVYGAKYFQILLCVYGGGTGEGKGAGKDTPGAGSEEKRGKAKVYRVVSIQHLRSVLLLFL